VVVAHRHDMLSAVDLALVLGKGRQAAFGATNRLTLRPSSTRS
jgi:ABC-type protease/lipase transport system fused ATPase/permease subunit